MKVKYVLDHQFGQTVVIYKNFSGRKEFIQSCTPFSVPTLRCGRIHKHIYVCHRHRLCQRIPYELINYTS
jgi:hypothetical protein